MPNASTCVDDILVSLTIGEALLLRSIGGQDVTGLIPTALRAVFDLLVSKGLVAPVSPDKVGVTWYRVTPLGKRLSYAHMELSRALAILK